MEEGKVGFRDVEIEDLYDLATHIEKFIEEKDNSSGRLGRGDISLSLTLPRDNVLRLDDALHYALGRLPSTGYMPTDEISVDVWGVHFDIKAKNA